MKLQKVSRVYGTGSSEFHALDNIDLTIEKGKFVVILGPSGAGKSTLLNLIGGLDNPSSGSVIVDGEDITGYSENQLSDYRANNIGFIFQFYNILPSLTVLENVEIIRDELNVKNIEFRDDVSDLISYSFKPQMRILGPKYGKELGQIRKILSEIDGTAAKKELDETGVLTIELKSGSIELTPEELLIDTQQKEGLITQADRGVTVVLDTNLTPELIEEGFVREIISKIQTMRKEADFEVTDHISVSVKDNSKIKEIMNAHSDEIRHDVLADEIRFDTEAGYTKEWNINGEKVTLSVERN